MKKLLLIAVLLIGLAGCEEKEPAGHDVFLINNTDFPFKEVAFVIGKDYYSYTNQQFKQGFWIEKPVPHGYVIELILIYNENDVHTDELYPIVGDVKININEVYIPVGGLGITYDWL